MASPLHARSSCLLLLLLLLFLLLLDLLHLLVDISSKDRNVESFRAFSSKFGGDAA